MRTPLARVDGTMLRLSKAKSISTMEMTGGTMAGVIDKESRGKTASMPPFGLHGAPVAFKVTVYLQIDHFIEFFLSVKIKFTE